MMLQLVRWDAASQQSGSFASDVISPPPAALSLLHIPSSPGFLYISVKTLDNLSIHVYSGFAWRF